MLVLSVINSMPCWEKMLVDERTSASGLNVADFLAFYLPRDLCYIQKKDRFDDSLQEEVVVFCLRAM